MWNSRISDHPHGRGEKTTAMSSSIPLAGSSPRAWGKAILIPEDRPYGLGGQWVFDTQAVSVATYDLSVFTTPTQAVVIADVVSRKNASDSTASEASLRIAGDLEGSNNVAETAAYFATTSATWQGSTNAALSVLSNAWPYIVSGSDVFGGSTVTNLDTITRTGFYVCGANAIGSPYSNTSAYVIHQQLASDRAMQIAFSGSVASLEMFVRAKEPLFWIGWTGGAKFSEIGRLDGVADTITNLFAKKTSHLDSTNAATSVVSSWVPNWWSTESASWVPSSLTITIDGMPGSLSSNLVFSTGYGPRLDALAAGTDNWDAAYGWGNHALAGYLGAAAWFDWLGTNTYVKTETDAIALAALNNHTGSTDPHPGKYAPASATNDLSALAASIPGIVYSNAVSQMVVWTNATGAVTNMAVCEGGTWKTNAFAQIAAGSGSVPYTDWTGTVTPQNGTATVTYANGNMPVLVVPNGGGITYVTIATDTYAATSGVSRVSLSIWAGENTVELVTNEVDYATAPDIPTNGWGTILFRRVSNGKWKGVGL